MKVSEAMSRDVRICTPGSTIRECAKAMAEIDAGAIPVGENDRLIGMVTDRDMAIRAIAQGKGPVRPSGPALSQQDTARRRTVSYGASYDYGAEARKPSPPIPAFLHFLREKVAGWSGVPTTDFEFALINEYQAGTPLGWHRD